MGRNGHKASASDDPAINPVGPPANDVGLFGNEGSFEKLIKNVEEPGMARHFVEAGKEARDLFMRTNVKNDEEINSLVLCVYRAKRCGWEDMLNMVQDKLALRRSINSESMRQLLQLGVGQLSHEIAKQDARVAAQSQKDNR